MMVRSSCYDNLNVKKGLWTAEEDAKVLAYVSKHGTGNWTAVPKKAGLKRCGKSCRLRYTNYLRPDLKHDNFSPQEEELIVKLHSAIGSRWSMIAQQLPGRTDNDVKNYWNTKLKKKLSEMGIDPVTHKPFSQILTDYGNIGGGFPKGGNTTRIGSFLNRDFKNAFMIKSEHDQTQALINCRFTANLMSPEVDLTRNSFFNNNDDNDESNNNSLDLLAQLQAIKLVSDQATSYIKNETIQANFMTQGLALSPSSSPLSSSSSSTCSTAAQVMSPQAFSWEDFLLEDAFFLPASSVGETQSFIMPHSEFSSDGGKKISGSVGEVNNGGLSNSFEASTSSDASFVEAMLERDNEMLLEFPSLLEEPFYY